MTAAGSLIAEKLADRLPKLEVLARRFLAGNKSIHLSRTGEWEPLDPSLVVEIQYDHFSGDRFPARYEVSALAARQGAAPMHDGSSAAPRPDRL